MTMGEDLQFMFNNTGKSAEIVKDLIRSLGVCEKDVKEIVIGPGYMTITTSTSVVSSENAVGTAETKYTLDSRLSDLL
jgi:hypothetical protein